MSERVATGPRGGACRPHRWTTMLAWSRRGGHPSLSHRTGALVPSHARLHGHCFCGTVWCPPGTYLVHVRRPVPGGGCMGLRVLRRSTSRCTGQGEPLPSHWRFPLRGHAAWQVVGALVCKPVLHCACPKEKTKPQRRAAQTAAAGCTKLPVLCAAAVLRRRPPTAPRGSVGDAILVAGQADGACEWATPNITTPFAPRLTAARTPRPTRPITISSSLQHSCSNASNEEHSSPWCGEALWGLPFLLGHAPCGAAQYHDSCLGLGRALAPRLAKALWPVVVSSRPCNVRWSPPPTSPRSLPGPTRHHHAMCHIHAQGAAAAAGGRASRGTPPARRHPAPRGWPAARTATRRQCGR